MGRATGELLCTYVQQQYPSERLAIAEYLLGGDKQQRVNNAHTQYLFACTATATTSASSGAAYLQVGTTGTVDGGKGGLFRATPLEGYTPREDILHPGSCCDSLMPSGWAIYLATWAARARSIMDVFVWK